MPISNPRAGFFTTGEPSCGKCRIADVTYVRTLEAFAYLAVVIDLKPPPRRRLIDAEPSEDGRSPAGITDGGGGGKPKQRVLIHPDQGSHFTSSVLRGMQ